MFIMFFNTVIHKKLYSVFLTKEQIIQFHFNHNFPFCCLIRTILIVEENVVVYLFFPFLVYYIFLY